MSNVTLRSVPSVVQNRMRQTYSRLYRFLNLCSNTGYSWILPDVSLGVFPSLAMTILDHGHGHVATSAQVNLL